MKPVNNSTRASRDLTEDEVSALRLVNHGTKPSRARAGTTQKSKEAYIAATLKAAGVTPATETRQEEDDEAEETQQQAGSTQQEADDKTGETIQVEAGEEEVEPPESQSHQEPSNRGWEVNYLLDYDVLYGDDQGDQFVENPLASEDRRRPR